LPPTTAAQAAEPVASQLASQVGQPITFAGHGWGHGRGMGQYGALGYAIDSSWGYAAILAHYYGGTTLSGWAGHPAGGAGNPTISVELTRLTGADTLVRSNNGPILINGVSSGASAVRVSRVGGAFQAYTGPTCWGPWSPINGLLGSGLTISTTGDQADVNNSPIVCELGRGETLYRGHLAVVYAGGTQYALNIVPIEDYLRGVVPRESPASWGAAGSGRGMEALKAQAVAARSYVLGSGAQPTSGASTCDTTACQVYGGAWASVGYSESAYTDAAVQATSGQVMRFANNNVARTEFSSSTGGYTAGGTFPPVEDLGDATASNPNHSWNVSIDASTVAAGLGTGPIQSITVLARNGLGADGGRVTVVRVVTTAGQVADFTGNQVRTALGLKSDWFSISGFLVQEAQQVIKALYKDMLGRGVDPSGLQTWTDYVLATGSARALAEQIATSSERMGNLVAVQYRLALHREPEPAGLAFWIQYLQAGRGVYDLEVGIYGSPESLQTLGGGDVPTWVGGMYTALLGRPSAPSERQFWTDIAARYGRSFVASAIAQSDEACMRRLTDYYQTFLLRGVDPSGRATFLPLMTGRGDFDIPIALGSSPEYWSRAQTRVF
jgi:SpoIID/LytB domain protein